MLHCKKRLAPCGKGAHAIRPFSRAHFGRRVGEREAKAVLRRSAWNATAPSGVATVCAGCAARQLSCAAPPQGVATTRRLATRTGMTDHVSDTAAGKAARAAPKIALDGAAPPPGDALLVERPHVQEFGKLPGNPVRENGRCATRPVQFVGARSLQRAGKSLNYIPRAKAARSWKIRSSCKAPSEIIRPRAVLARDLYTCHCGKLCQLLVAPLCLPESARPQAARLWQDERLNLRMRHLARRE